MIANLSSVTKLFLDQCFVEDAILEIFCTPLIVKIIKLYRACIHMCVCIRMRVCFIHSSLRVYRCLWTVWIIYINDPHVRTLCSSYKLIWAWAHISYSYTHTHRKRLVSFRKDSRSNSFHSNTILWHPNVRSIPLKLIYIISSN